MVPQYQNPDIPECGAAIFAMLAGISLAKAKEQFYENRQPKRVGRSYIIKQLAEHNKFPLTAKAVQISEKNKIIHVKNDALVYARVLIDGEYGLIESHHWVVWDGRAQAIRDPLGFVLPVRLTSFTEIVDREKLKAL